MKNIVIILLFIAGLLMSACSKSTPQPSCEEGGVEVTT